MANFFDQFDAPASPQPSPPTPNDAAQQQPGISVSQAPQSDGGNYFDRYDAPAPAAGPERSATVGSMAANVGAGVDTSLIAGTLGAVTGMPTELANAIVHNPLDPKWKMFENPLPAEWWNKQLAKIGVGEEALPAPTAAEKYARAAGETTGDILSTLLPAKAELATAEAAGRAAAPAAEVLGAGSVPSNVALGLAAGAGGQAGADVAPPGYERLGSEIGSLGVGAAGAGAGEMAAATGRGAAHLYSGIPPLMPASREAAAGAGAASAFRGAAGEGAGGLEQEIEAALPTSELVPGSTRTTAEILNNPGLLSAQRVRERIGEAQIPEQGNQTIGQALQQQRATNTQARMGALEGMAPAGTGAEAAQGALQSRLAAIDQIGDSAAAAARSEAANRAAAITPQMTPEEQGAAASAAVEAQRAPVATALAQASDQARSAADQSMGEFGGAEALAPENRAAALSAYGAQMRDPVAAASAAERGHLTDLRAAIDPTGQMGMRPDAIKSALGEIEQTFAPSRGLFSGVENSLYGQVRDFGDLIPIETAFGLRADINSRLRRPDLEPREQLRLGILKRGIDQALSDATTDIGTGEAAGVIHQGMPPIEARMSGVGQPLTGNSVFTPTGRQIGVRYAVRDLAAPDAPIASHTVDGEPNPEYPAALQPRDRSRQASTIQIRQMAPRLQPERLGASASPQEGAPIVGPDQAVESGNGRLLAIRHAYDQNMPSAQAYRAWLEQQGYSTEGMAQPALIRERTTPLSDQDRLSFARESNVSATAGMSATEQAKLDAGKLSPAILDQYAGGDITRAANRDFARAFVRSVASPGEENQLFLPDGSLSVQGASRIRNALLQRAYGDSGLVGSLAEAGDDDLKSFGGAMQDAAGEMSRLRSAIEGGAVTPDRDLAPALVDAARLVKMARERGRPLFEIIAQQDAFNPISEETENILRAAYGDNFRGRVSRVKLASVLAYYAEETERLGQAHDLFGEQPDTRQLLQAGASNYERNRGAAASIRKPVTTSFAGTGIGEGGPEAQRPELGEAGAQPPASGPGRAAPTIAESLAEPELTPLTPEAQQRFADWNKRYAEWGRAYRGETPGKLHAVGKMLQRGGAYDSYRLTDGEVPWLFLNGGKTEADAVGRFLSAAPLEAHAALDDAMGFSLRRAAQKPDGTLDLAKYRKWTDTHAGALSARPDLASKFDNAASAQRQLDEINQSLADHEASHPLNPGWGEAGVLPRFWKPGPQGGESMRRYLAITGNRPDAVDAAIDYAAWSFANRAIQNGKVVPGAADVWLKQHAPALDAVPGLRDRFANAVDAQRTLEQVIAQHQVARDDFTRSVAGVFLQDDPERAVTRLFSGADRGQKASALMGLLQGNPAAIEGVQRGVIDMIRRRFEGSATPGTDVGGLMPTRFGDFVDENKSVLRSLFPGRAQVFDAIARDLESSTRAAAAKAPGGSDTAEILSRAAASGAGPSAHAPQGIPTLLAALLGERVGEHLAGHALLGPAGAILGPVAAMATRGARNALRMRQEAIFDQMLLDPQTASDVLRANPGRSAVVRPDILNRLSGRIVQQALASARGSPTP